MTKNETISQLSNGYVACDFVKMMQKKKKT